MTLSSLGRASAIGVAISLLAGCGGSSQGQSSIPSTPSAIRQATHNGKSWIKPGSSSADLLYITGGCEGTCVVSYPGGTLVGSIGFGDTAPCADSRGNVYIPQQSQVQEYPHGGTTPIATFSAGHFINGCSVDPTTGNLAVVGGATVTVFTSSSGFSFTYTIDASDYCGYDNNGNLFVDGQSSSGTALYELPAGGQAFEQLTLSEPLGGNPFQVQWDGRYLSIEEWGAPTISFYRLSISGLKATVVKKIRIRGLRRGNLSWINAGKVFIPMTRQGHESNTNRVGVWRYPKGGRALTILPHVDNGADFQGVTYSSSE
ncbi:MAG TPA: hypothetical protein VIX83_04515 [Candidatus Cybelea sp.]